MKKKNMTLVYPISMSQSPSRCTPPFESPSPRVSPLSLPPPSPSVQVSPFKSTPFEPHLPHLPLSLCSFRVSSPLLILPPAKSPIYKSPVYKSPPSEFQVSPFFQVHTLLSPPPSESCTLLPRIPPPHSMTPPL